MPPDGQTERVALATHEVDVTTVGAASAPAVLLLHGVGSSGRFLVDAFAEPLTTAGWRLVAADVRGHGRSTPWPDPADHALAHLAQDVIELVGWSGARVVGGVSLGGHAAVEAAARGAEVDAVVACLPAWTGTAEPGVGPHAAVAGQVRATGIAGMLEGFDADTSMVPWLREVLLRDWAACDPTSLQAALLALDGGRAPDPTAIAGLRVPLGLVAWADDPGHPLAVAEEWARLARRSVLEQISLDGAQADLTVFGAAAVAALAGLGVTPDPGVASAVR